MFVQCFRLSCTNSQKLCIVCMTLWLEWLVVPCPLCFRKRTTWLTLLAADLVLQVCDALQPGAQLCVNDCALNPERDMYEQQQASLYEQQRQQQLQEKQQMKAEMEALVNQKK